MDEENEQSDKNENQNFWQCDNYQLRIRQNQRDVQLYYQVWVEVWSLEIDKDIKEQNVVIYFCELNFVKKVNVGKSPYFCG